MSEVRNFLPILEKLRVLLIKSKNVGQAEVIDKLISLINDTEIESFTKYLNSVDVWGGAGAVWEINISDTQDYKEFQQEILNLIDLMEKTNISNGKLKSIKNYFQKDLNDI